MAVRGARLAARDTGNQGPEADAQITGLDPGGYDASWLLAPGCRPPPTGSRRA